MRKILPYYIVLLILCSSSAIHGQTTAFTYQGNLKVGGSNANGNFDFEFALFVSGGSQIGSTLTRSGVQVTEGVFTTDLDFGNNYTGADRLLEIRVRPAGSGAFTTLSPRQLLRATPYSIVSVSSLLALNATNAANAVNAGSATNAAQLGGIAANQYVLTGDPRLSDERDPLPGSTSYVQNRTTAQPGTNFNVSGNGTVSALTARENSFFEKGISVGTTLVVGASATIGGSVTVGTNVNAGNVTTTGGVTVGTALNAGSINTTGSVTVGGTLNTAAISSTGAGSVGGTLSAGALNSTGPVAGSTVNAIGTVNTGSQFNVGGNFALGRSRLDLFNTAASPSGYSFQVLNSPNFLILKNESGSTLMTIAHDGKVGIGDNTPTQATLEVGGTVEISGTLSVGQLGGSLGDPLCKGTANTVRACSAVGVNQATTDAKVDELESKLRDQQAEIERQRAELAALKNLVCSKDSAAEICARRR
jgi:hypothetical protein